MLLILAILAILATTLLTGVELCVGLFVHPVLGRLPDAAHAAAAKPLARVLGRAMPFWYAAALLLVLLSLPTHPAATRPWWACLTAAALLAGTIPFSLICLVPINTRIAAWDLNDLPAGWKDDRRKWDRYHRLRILMLLLASLAIVTAGLCRSPVA